MVEARVGLEPLRALPARALEEDGAEIALGGPQRRAPQAAQLLVLLARMQRVVDLAVLLRAARPRVRAREAVRVEALRVALVQVRADVAAGEQLGERLARAAGVGDPDGLAQPQPARGGGLADQRHPVGGERHQAVEGAHALRAADGGQEPRRLLGGALEVLGREGQDRRLLAAVRPRPDRLGVDEPRLVVVVADPVGVADLAEVEVGVLVAQQRVRDLARLPGELGQRRGDRVLVHDRREREPDAREPRHLRAPDAGGEHDRARADPPAGGLDRADLPALELEAGDLGVAEGLHARGDRGARHRLRGLDRLGDAVRGDVEAADDPLRVDQRDERLDLLRARAGRTAGRTTARGRGAGAAPPSGRRSPPPRCRRRSGRRPASRRAPPSAWRTASSSPTGCAGTRGPARATSSRRSPTAGPCRAARRRCGRAWPGGGRRWSRRPRRR